MISPKLSRIFLYNSKGASDNLAKGSHKVCAFYNRPKGCLRKDRCPNLHIKIDTDGLSHDKVPVLKYDEDQSDILPSPGAYITVNITSVQSPSQFYVNLPFGSQSMSQCVKDPTVTYAHRKGETLEDLMASMSDFYKSSVHYDGDLTLLASGQALAASIKGVWTRVKVLDSDVEQGLVKVMAVDYGSVEWVEETDIRELDLRFIHLTPQAVECGLADAEPFSGALEWTEEACEIFQELVKGKSMVAFVKDRFLSGRITLTLFDPNSEEEISTGQALVEFGLASPITVNPRETDQDSDKHRKKDMLFYMPV